MEDYQIVDLYWERDEKAIHCTDQKYGRLLNSLSFSFLSSREDAEECVNDTYLSAWNAMPTDRPIYLGAYLSKIIRRISIDRFRHDHRKKRGGFDTLTEELTEAIPDVTPTPPEAYEQERLKQSINDFLATLPPVKRVIFIERYFYNRSVSEIAGNLQLRKSNVKVILHRVREALREFLEGRDCL